MNSKEAGAEPGRRVRVQKLTYDGKPGYSYFAELLEANTRIVVRAPFASPHGQPVFLPELGITLEEGELWVEYYYRDRWYNVLKIFDVSGRLKGYYCNICLPAEFDGQVITWRDLALDVYIFPDGTHRVLDEAEFEASDLYPPEVRAKARQAVAELLDLAARGESPFDELKGGGG